MSNRIQKPSNLDPELEAKIGRYIREKPDTKRTIASREIYRRFGLTNRKSGDILAYMSNQDGGPVGERLEDNRQARWRLNHE